MESETLFRETQKFRQWWLWLGLISLDGVFLFGLCRQLMYGEQFGDRPMNNTLLIISVVIVFLITYLFLSMRLETVIKRNGIYVRYFPFHLTLKYYPWNMIKRSYVREYSALLEYGGWGLRVGISGKGMAYNVSGNKGLQLEFMDNSQLMIGTKKSEELVATLNDIGN